jgi:LAO/AO transport system kinase
VVSTVAARLEGLDDLVAALDAHRSWIDASGERERRRLARASGEIEAITLEQMRARIGDVRGGAGLAGLAKRVVAGEIDPYRAADELTGAVGP